MELTVPRLFRRRDDHVYRQIAGEHLLVSLHRREKAPLFALTPTGAAVWRHLDTWTTPDAIARRLADEFEVNQSEAEADVASFLEQLETVGAVDVREEGA